MEPNSPAPDVLNQIGGKQSKLSSLSRMPKQGKLIMIGGGAFLLLLGLIIIYNLFIKTPDNAPILQTVGEQQARILQAAETGVEKSRGQEARNLAVTAELSLSGDQRPLLDALRKQNIRISTRDDPELAQELITAEQANRFDEFLMDYLSSELADYVRNLDRAYRSTESQSLRELLESQFENARFLAGVGADEIQEE